MTFISPSFLRCRFIVKVSGTDPWYIFFSPNDGLFPKEARVFRGLLQFVPFSEQVVENLMSHPRPPLLHWIPVTLYSNPLVFPFLRLPPFPSLLRPAAFSLWANFNVQAAARRLLHFGIAPLTLFFQPTTFFAPPVLSTRCHPATFGKPGFLLPILSLFFLMPIPPITFVCSLR